MGCSGLYATGARLIGHMCGEAYDGPKRFCCRCRKLTDLLCDGPRDFRRVPEVDDAHDESRLCSVSVCTGCAVSIRSLDSDFCPDCASLVTRGECLLATIGPSMSQLARCHGALVAIASGSLCIRHAVLFDHWHAFHGGESVYSDRGLNREQRREEHRRWLRTLSDLRIADILLQRNAPFPEAQKSPGQPLP